MFPGSLRLENSRKILPALLPIEVRILDKVLGRSSGQSYSLILIFIQTCSEVMRLAQRNDCPLLIDLESGVNEGVLPSNPAGASSILSPGAYLVEGVS